MIAQPYLLVLNIPLYCHAGAYWAEPLWKKDLEAHRAEISDLSVACPVLNTAPPAGWERLVSDIAVHSLPAMSRLAPLHLPRIARRLWRAIGAADIVHTGVAGWPFPLGWIAVPFARLRRRTTVLVVESAFWRLEAGAPASLRARARAALWERLNRRLAAACDISFFTTRAYREELHDGGDGAAHVLPAVWIDQDGLIDRDRLEERQAARRGRLLFAGRLTRAKGVALLLDAVERSGVAVDFIGEGELADAVDDASRRLPHLVRRLNPVEPGAAFMTLLDSYAALVVPTISDEQPRVIFDAFARGLGVLASATAGNRQVVEDGRTGRLFPVADIDALAAALVDSRADPAALAHLGRCARDVMDGRTHAAMHAQRAALILEAMATPSRVGRE